MTSPKENKHLYKWDHDPLFEKGVKLPHEIMQEALDKEQKKQNEKNRQKNKK